MNAFRRPFPLDGGRVGMGVTTVLAGALANAAFAPLEPTQKSSALTPIPAPSPIEGEGRGALP